MQGRPASDDAKAASTRVQVRGSTWIGPAPEDRMDSSDRELARLGRGIIGTVDELQPGSAGVSGSVHGNEDDPDGGARD